MTTLWTIDPAHSEIQFKVRHLMITTVTGYFRKFDLLVETEDEDFTQAKKIEFTADAGSIDTNSEQRDTHLRSADFFETDTYKTITFESTRIVKQSADTYAVTGRFTIRDVTREITLPVIFLGTAKDPWGNERIAFETEYTVNRKDYGLTWNAALETGGFLVGDDVTVSLSIQAIPQA